MPTHKLFFVLLSNTLFFKISVYYSTHPICLAVQYPMTHWSVWSSNIPDKSRTCSCGLVAMAIASLSHMQQVSSSKLVFFRLFFSSFFRSILFFHVYIPYPFNQIHLIGRNMPLTKVGWPYKNPDQSRFHPDTRTYVLTTLLA